MNEIERKMHKQMVKLLLIISMLALGLTIWGSI